MTLIRLPIVFTPCAGGQRAVLLEQSDHAEKLQDRLSHMLRAALEAHFAYPHRPYVMCEVIHIEPTGHLDQA